ncbi:MAG TPA: hypothetical protein VMT54_04770, partial [Candidatus Cybelea sp.]|nr:hypothetical protein [Candidatus Cybelea sp.]
MNTQSLTLISNGSATGPWTTWRGGSGTFEAVGTFNGGTVRLQKLGPDGTTPIDVGTDTTLTAAGGGNFQLPPSQIRAAVTGSPSAIYAQ